jgi:PKD repeat protein
VVAAPAATAAAAPTADRTTDERRRSRGQSMVEFALVLPILFVLLLIAVDFGRVYLGYINVQNMARIAANEAATNPDGWFNADATVQASYRQQILEDARAINCDLPMSGGTLGSAADPTFSGWNVGDTATVSITCDFGVITPVISNIVGGTVTVGGAATFPVRTGMIANGGATGGGIDAPAVDFFADKTSIPEGTAAQFHYSGGGGTPTSIFWDFGDGNTGTGEDPLHTYAAAGAYDVTVTATNSAGSDEVTKTSYIIVLPSSSIAFSATPLSGTRPLTVAFKDESADAVKWAWDFGDGTTSDEENPTKVYANVGTYDVSLEIEDSTGAKATLEKTAYITVGAGLCTVPNFYKVSTDSAQSLWSGAGFTTVVQFADKLPYSIKKQSIVGASVVPCSSTITVSKN